MSQCSSPVLLYSASLSCRAACIEPLCIGRLYNAPAYTACQCDNSRRSRPLLSALLSCSSTAWVFLTGTAAPRRSCAPPHTARLRRNVGGKAAPRWLPLGLSPREERREHLRTTPINLSLIQTQNETKFDLPSKWTQQASPRAARPSPSGPAPTSAPSKKSCEARKVPMMTDTE